MVHQPSAGFQGQASDIERHAEDILKTKRRLNEIYVKHTGQPYEIIERTLDRDHFMSAEQAKAFGIIDEVITKRAPGRRGRRRGAPEKAAGARWQQQPLTALKVSSGPTFPAASDSPERMASAGSYGHSAQKP